MIPNMLFEDEDCIPADLALEASKIILEEEFMTVQQIDDFLKGFDFIIQSDMIAR